MLKGSTLWMTHVGNLSYQYQLLQSQALWQWEDTIIFPAIRKVLSPKRLKELGEQFENEEDRLFGKDGFEKVVEEVASIEKQLGIFDLSQFTQQIKMN